jgi:hypothetical protein
MSWSKRRGKVCSASEICGGAMPCRYRLEGKLAPVALTGRYIIGTQEYGRFYLKKRMSFGLHKCAFLKASDAVRQRATLSLL